ncbi:MULTISPECIES: trans-sulfuration enzyme family protein [Rhizobium]|uniref:Methionine-gamma-lyase n=1 Tax=Rhizobium esperanzae TaxID=1967781 RepID=A0A7W6UNQ2_9HYPH|nr:MULTISPECIES: PLP-dependent aspartate aminotransferase family protein [Rhizobium]MBB4441476.1 methionine-gamma-lyase [Rhizobium esperanzae]MBX5164708.1 PLP-dependent transferase [Rhizobium sp. NZLR4b]MBX5192257.1 PLP-dependent transferase [Rhizobium sp. NZLR3b]MBX5205555.1 PLP-dependent transferase [Rhizobium sp. NZLR1]MBY5345187.1 PLP-dependent transferase [Rhizobium leguminosarum]
MTASSEQDNVQDHSDPSHGARLGFDTRAIHHAFDPADFSRAVQPPVFLTSTYGFESVAANDAAAALGGRLYAREYNPTTEILEKRLANLEGAEAGLVVSTGMAAFGTLVLSLLSQGDELVVHKTLYSNTVAMVEQCLPRFGIRVVPVDLSNPNNLDAAITDKTRLVYFETPVNPLSAILDISAIAARAHARNVKVAVDSTFASPSLQRPIEHGADIVLHSLTKYINGHGDTLGGALLGDAETLHTLHETGLRYITGATLSPHSAFLILRGLKTLSLRMERHSASALIIAHMLEAHPAVAWVSYPFLDSHPDHTIAHKQMTQGAGMLAFGLHAGFDGARTMLDRLQLLTRAVSLGDTDSLIYHPASITRARQAIRKDAHLIEGVGEDLVRLSVGLEDVSDLVADLRQALQDL